MVFLGSGITAVFVSTPKATMNEYHYLVLGENDVWFAYKFFGMEAKLKSRAVKNGPNSDFRGGITASNSHHISS